LINSWLDLKLFDSERPIAFKVKIQRDDRFTHLNILKIESLVNDRFR